MIARMVAIARRRQRDKGPSVFLQARVHPAIRERARRGADARGITVSRYMEELILSDELAEADPEESGETEQERPA